MKPEKDKDYYLHGGVEKHPTYKGVFIVYGTVYGEPWQCVFDEGYSLEEAMPLAQKKILGDAVQVQEYLEKQRTS